MNHQQGELGTNTKKLQQVIALVGVLLIAIGECIVVAQPVNDSIIFPPYFWLEIPGIILIVLSLIVKTNPKIEARLSFPETIFEVSISFMLCGLALFASILFGIYGRNNYLSVTIMWFASGALFILAFREPINGQLDLKRWFQEHKTEIILLGIAVLLAAILRLYQLGGLPKIMDGDEGLIGVNAQTTSNGALANPFALWENFGSLYLQVIDFLIKIFGPSPMAVRLLPAISGILAIPALYLFARQVAGKHIAIISAVFLVFSHAHIHFSRIGSVGYIHGTWLVPLELYLLLSGLEKRSSWRAAAGGVLLAMHFRVYLTSQIIVGLILVYMLISFFFMKEWFRPALKQAGIFWVGFILMLFPQVYYIIHHPDEFLTRLNNDGTFQSGWLTTTMASTGQSAIQILSARVVHAFLSLIYYPAVDFYGSSTPLLNLFSAILFLIGIGLVLLRTKSPGYLLLNGYFWAATIAIGIFALPPSADSYRMLTALPPALIMAAVGLDYVLAITGISWPSNKMAYTFSVSSALAVMMILGVWTYYVSFAGECKYGGGPVGRFASYLGSYTKTVNGNSEIHLLSDSIYFYGSHASTDYLSDHRKIINDPNPVDSYEIKPNETLIATPARANELLEWIQIHPGGKITTIYDCSNPILISYQIPDKGIGP